MGTLKAQGHHDALMARESQAGAAADVLERLGHALDLPAGHSFRFDRRHELMWNVGRPGATISAYIERVPGDPSDAQQLHGEIRIHLRESEPRATVWLEEGARYLGRSRDVLAGASVLAAESLEDLASKLHSGLASSLLAWSPPAPECEGFRP